MKKIQMMIFRLYGFVTLFCFVFTNIAAQALPLGSSGRQNADTIIRRLDTDARAKDRVAWLARAREGLLEVSADWERTILAAGGRPGAMTLALSAELDTAYADRLVSGFFDDDGGAELKKNATAAALSDGSSARFPELTFYSKENSAATLTVNGTSFLSAKTYEGKALAVTELTSEVAGGVYSEYSIAPRDAKPEPVRYVSETSIAEKSNALKAQARAILQNNAQYNESALLVAAQESLTGLSFWDKVEVLITADTVNSRSRTSATSAPQSDKTTHEPEDQPSAKQSWLSYGSSQDALTEALM